MAREPKREPKEVEILKIAVVGCGKMGVNHVRAIKGCRGVRIVGVSDPAGMPDALAALLPGVPCFARVGELLDAVAPDVVHIVTPPDTHADLAVECLRRGAHAYVEKPFTLNVADARKVLRVAQEVGRSVCAGHQLLYERPARSLRTALPLIGGIVHVESYFSFQTVRKSRDGRTLMSPLAQLLDILPHPVYTLLDAVCAGHPDIVPALTAVSARAEGDVHVIVRAGETTGMLVVTLRGRPIESYLRVIGTNGFLRADFVRGAVTRLAGPGASAIPILLNPYREALQIVLGSTRNFASRLFGKSKGYPGLAELCDAFYESIRQCTAPPVSASSILETVRICEQVGEALQASDERRELDAEARLAERTRALPAADGRRGVLVTGGTGLLGTAVIREFRERGWSVRSVSRSTPPFSRREPGVEYASADLSRPLDGGLFSGITTVVHCAAETAGGKEAHERNTLAATRHVLQAAARARVERVIHVSSIAVLVPGAKYGRPLDEQAPVDAGNLARGPYVWAKAEAERYLTEAAGPLGLDVRIVRPGPLVDYANYQPPGRLGREAGPIFVAVGPRRGTLSLCDIRTAALAIRAIAEDPTASPRVVNLVEPEAPTRERLAAMHRARRPDLRVFWLPAWLLRVLSVAATLAQKVLRPRTAAIDLAAAFAAESYDATVAASVIARGQRSTSVVPVADRDVVAV